MSSIFLGFGELIFSLDWAPLIAHIAYQERVYVSDCGEVARRGHIEACLSSDFQPICAEFWDYFQLWMSMFLLQI